MNLAVPTAAEKRQFVAQSTVLVAPLNESLHAANVWWIGAFCFDRELQRLLGVQRDCSGFLGGLGDLVLLPSTEAHLDQPIP